MHMDCNSDLIALSLQSDKVPTHTDERMLNISHIPCIQQKLGCAENVISVSDSI